MDSLSAADAFSGVVLLAEGDSILLLEARGQADRNAGRANTPDTRFNVGSLSKAFTTIAVHQLEARGLLTLDDTLARYLPSYPNPSVARRVTIRHLLEMSSGIPDFFNERYATAPKEKLTSLDAYLPLIADLPLDFEPGTRRRYSNGGFLLLGLVIEAVAGTDYYSYIRDHIYAPADMRESGSPSTAERDERYAVGYAGPGRSVNTETLPGRGSSAGGGYSTARDLLRFVRALEKGTLRHPSAPEGLGIAGGAPGLNAALEWDRSRGIVVIVLANLDPPAAEALAHQLIGTAPGD
jgi:CubicO group peptidase (beta-lactamase class C family)